eukprot:3324503-Rhodomonas_salina.1
MSSTGTDGLYCAAHSLCRVRGCAMCGTVLGYGCAMSGTEVACAAPRKKEMGLAAQWRQTNKQWYA